MLLKTHLPGFRKRLNSLRKREDPEGRKQWGWRGGKGSESLESEGWGEGGVLRKSAKLWESVACAPKGVDLGRLDPGEKKMGLRAIQENTCA